MYMKQFILNLKNTALKPDKLLHATCRLTYSAVQHTVNYVQLSSAIELVAPYLQSINLPVQCSGKYAQIIINYRNYFGGSYRKLGIRNNLTLSFSASALDIVRPGYHVPRHYNIYILEEGPHFKYGCNQGRSTYLQKNHNKSVE